MEYSDRTIYENVTLALVRYLGKREILRIRERGGKEIEIIEKQGENKEEKEEDFASK